MDTSEPDLRTEIDYAISVVDQVLQCADALRKSENAGDAHIYAVALHATILNLLAGCIALAETGRDTGVPILLRSMYEALVDLDNLVHVNGYEEHMEAANLKQVTRIARSPALGALFDGSMGRTQTDLDALVDGLETLKKKDKGPLSISRRCELAHRSDEYESLYSLFCLDAHNNLAALADRHIQGFPSGLNYEIGFLDPPDGPRLARRLRFGVGFLVQSAEMIHGAFRVPLPQIDALVRAHSARTSSPSEYARAVKCPASAFSGDPPGASVGQLP
jgi:hypothetical protein